ncbi:hypothetical protein ScPMuIL_018389 [Solemya velum]
MAESETMVDFFHAIPKIELHAHINGSISTGTMKKLLDRKEKKILEHCKTTFEEAERGTLDDCFKIFSVIHQISDSTEAAYTITTDVIREFAEDNVKYLELRSTPRDIAKTGMTKQSYIEAVLKAIEDCKSQDLDIVVKFILAIDRRNGVEVAKETLDLAEKYRNISSDTVVGLDLSGDPYAGDARDYIPVFRDAKRRGLKLALHLAEVPNKEETMALLKVLPDRIGHGTCLHQEAGGSLELVEFVAKHRIPLELCLTSNVKGRTVSDFDNHQFKLWYDLGHPCIICTDDKGVFSTSLSQEYSIAANTFGLSNEAVLDMACNSIEHIFAEDNLKATLRDSFQEQRHLLLKTSD